eukprot:s397_g16.t1
MACLGSSCLSALDLRFPSLEDEANFLALLAERRRLQTLVSGISVAAVWLYVQLVLAEVLDLRTWLTLCSALLWLLAAVTMAVPKSQSKLCINQEWIWVPVASFSCALMAQPRSEENSPSRLCLVSVAVSATAMLPLRSAVSWLVYVTAVFSFVLGSLSFDSSNLAVGADSVALLLVATSFYHAAWCREVDARGSAHAEDQLEGEALSGHSPSSHGKGFAEGLQSEEESEKEPVASVTDHLVLRIAGDLTILPCSIAEHRYFGADPTGKSLLDYLTSEDHHSVLLLIRSELWHSRSIIVRIQLASRHESLRLRLLQTGAADPAWLAFLSAVDAPTRMQAVLPSVPDDDCQSIASQSIAISAGPSRHTKRSLSQKSMRSIRSIEDQLSPRLHLHGGENPGSPSLRIPIFQSNASLDDRRGDASHSIFSLSACSWSFSTDGYKPQAPVRPTSEGQTQTELVWNDLGWQCRNCAKPPKPPSTQPEAMAYMAPSVIGKVRSRSSNGKNQSYRALSPEERRNDQLLRMQGCWVLCDGFNWQGKDVECWSSPEVQAFLAAVLPGHAATAAFGHCSGKVLATLSKEDLRRQAKDEEAANVIFAELTRLKQVQDHVSQINASGAQPFQLHIRTPADVVLQLEVHPTDTISRVKARLASLEGTPVERQRLVLQGSPLLDNRSLASCGVGESTVLLLVPRLNQSGARGFAPAATVPAPPKPLASGTPRPRVPLVCTDITRPFPMSLEFISIAEYQSFMLSIQRQVGRRSLTSTLSAVVEADEASPFLEILSNDNMRPPARDLGEGGEAR